MKPQHVLKAFSHPDEAREFPRGRFEIVKVGGMTIGRATYEPGWKWSEHVGPSAGTALCEVEHVGVVVSGRAAVAYKDGTTIELTAGQAFYIPPVAHDSWVIGNDRYVSLHLMGAEQYSR